MTAALTQLRKRPSIHGGTGIDAHATAIPTSGQVGNPRHAGDVQLLLKARSKQAALMASLLFAYYFFSLLPATAQEPGIVPELLVVLALHAFVFFGGICVIITFLQLKVVHGRARWILLFSSMVAWAFVNAFWTASFGPFYGEPFSRDPEASFWHIAWTKSTYGLLAAWFYENADSAARMTAALRHSELARRSAERWVLELRLGIMQARVEPRVLFDALDEAGRVFPSHPAAAERLLDDLIDYLRRALPKLREHECTLGHEVGLVLSYARLLRGSQGGRLELEASVEPSIGDARFVPMVLQPLCEALVRPALATGKPARLSLDATRRGDAACVTVLVEPQGLPVASERLNDVRHTLDAMFAPHARIEPIGTATKAAGVLVEVPYVATPRAHS